MVWQQRDHDKILILENQKVTKLHTNQRSIERVPNNYDAVSYSSNITNLFEEDAMNPLPPAFADNLAQIGPKHGTRDTTPALTLH